MDVINSALHSKKLNKTIAKIDEVDESWALNLIKDYELDDEVISIQSHVHRKLRKNEALTKQTLASKTASQAKLSSAEVIDNYEDINALTLSLSAIENQKLELAQKREAEILAEVSKNTKSNRKFFRVLNFFKA